MEEVQTSFAQVLTLTAEEAEPLVIEEEEDDDQVSQDILERSLVVKLYSPKPFHKKSFKNRLLELWDSVGEVDIKDIPGNHFLFTFSRVEDKQNVVMYAPWKFDKKLVLIEEPDGNVSPSKMPLKFADFWVQIHNISLLKLSLQNQLGTE